MIATKADAGFTLEALTPEVNKTLTAKRGDSAFRIEPIGASENLYKASYSKPSEMHSAINRIALRASELPYRITFMDDQITLTYSEDNYDYSELETNWQIRREILEIEAKSKAKKPKSKPDQITP